MLLAGPQLDCDQGPLEVGHGRGHHRRVERSGHREDHRAQAEFARGRLGCRQHRPRTREDDLLGRVVVRDRKPVRDGDLLGALGRLGADQRDHAAVAGGLAGLLHQPAAQRDQLEAGSAR